MKPLHKSAILLVLVMLLVAGAIFVWFPALGHGLTPSQQPNPPRADGRATSATVHIGYPPPSASSLPPSVKPKPRMLQIGTEESAALQRKYLVWLKARGCDMTDDPDFIHKPWNTLRLKVLDGDLTAAGHLGLMLIWDGDQDRLQQGEKVWHKAILQGSTCALYDYIGYWRASHGLRHVSRDIHGRKWASYTIIIPKTEAAKRQAIMNLYAWYLVYAMRTGLPAGIFRGSMISAATTYRDPGFKPTENEYAQACQHANDLYQRLQSEREAEGLGPFDNSPPPMRMIPFDIAVIREAFGKPAEVKYFKTHPEAGLAWAKRAFSRIMHDKQLTDVGSHCAHWPVPKPNWQPVVAHNIRRDGKIEPNFIWVLASEIPTLKAGNE